MTVSTNRKSCPLRAEHIGSLLRPQRLQELKQKVTEGKASREDLEKLELEELGKIVDLQIRLGFNSITDGEFGRHAFWGDFFSKLDGLTLAPNDPATNAANFRPYILEVKTVAQHTDDFPIPTYVATGKIKHRESVFAEQFRALKSLVPAERWPDLKITMVEPEFYHFRLKEGKAFSKSAYASDEEYFSDLAKAYQAELKYLYENEGFRNLQLDSPMMSFFCDETFQADWAADPTNSRTLDETVDAYIRLNNLCLADRPADLHAGIHLCRGNYQTVHFATGAYDRIAARLFRDLAVDTFYLEYDTDRSGDFAALRHVPRGKHVVLGLVTTKFPAMEDLEALRGRVMEAAACMGEGECGSAEEALRWLHVSPQCGFASIEDGRTMSYEQMVEKLRLVRRLADSIWPGEP